MDEAETRTCTNCKREIPAVNFTIHTVHCARNIKVCPVCKEPVPQAELQDHHEKLHKLLPCSKCGERVCGTDLEDHIRDSCAHTIKSCRYCELELPRRELPTHEGYCGVRTEQCPDCREWVMIKYRQLHIDSNHGFIRLDDDPTPQVPKKETAKVTGIPKPTNTACSNGAWGLPGAAPRNGYVKNINLERPLAEIRPVRPGPSAGGSGGRDKPPLKRTNDQPQINTAVAAVNKINKDLGMSRGAVKKRPAPQPPPDPRRDLPYYSAAQRQQEELRQRREQTAANLAQGLPPVLSPLEKLERLRKMDMLHNRETEPGPARPRQGPSRLYPEAGRPQPVPDQQDRRNEFKNLKPMTPEEFMKRFNALQVGAEEDRNDNTRGGGGAARHDRFSEIKSSLRELRRGLNEVTAPYNSNSANNEPVNIARNERANRRQSSSESDSDSTPVDDALPCEFCDRLVPADDLVQHQTGCRPDLAQLRATRPRPPHPDDQPVIPCEFCTESLPVYLIQDHQERCRRDGQLLYPD